MGLQINQYPNTTVSLDPLAVFDVDNWTGAAFQSEQVPMSVMEGAFSKNIINSDLTQTANRVQDFAGFQQYWKNNNQLVIESSSTPVSGANMEIQGFGTTSSDELVNIQNNLGTVNTTFYGDGGLRKFGKTGHGIAPSPSIDYFLSSTTAYGFYKSGASSVAHYCADQNTASGFYARRVPSNAYGARSESVISSGGNSLFFADVKTLGSGVTNSFLSEAPVNAVYDGTSSIIGFNAIHKNITSNNTAFRAEVSGATTNLAIDIVNGDIRVPSGGLGFSGTGAYTNFTIEKGIIIAAS